MLRGRGEVLQNHLGRAGARVRDEEQQIVDKLDKLIEQIEQQICRLSLLVEDDPARDVLIEMARELDLAFLTYETG